MLNFFFHGEPDVGVSRVDVVEKQNGIMFQIGGNAIFHAIISEIGPHGPIFRGVVTKELRHGSS